MEYYSAHLLYRYIGSKKKITALSVISFGVNKRKYSIESNGLFAQKKAFFLLQNKLDIGII